MVDSAPFHRRSTVATTLQGAMSWHPIRTFWSDGRRTGARVGLGYGDPAVAHRHKKRVLVRPIGQSSADAWARRDGSRRVDGQPHTSHARRNPGARLATAR